MEERLRSQCDLKNEHKYGRFQLTMEECSKSQIVTLNAGRGQFYGENSFSVQPLRNNGILVREKAGFDGQTRGRVSRTDADCGLTDKRSLRFTDRRSSDFPDTCHLDFPDTRHLNFPDASHLTKQPKSGITNSAQKTSPAEKWSNLQTSWRFVVKKCYDESGNRASTSY